MGQSALRLIDGDGAVERDDPPELNLRIFRPLLHYVAEQFGADVLSELLEETGVQHEDLRRASAWISAVTAEKLVAWVRQRVDSDAEFMRACAYDLAALYGLMALPMRLMTVRAAYGALARTGHLVTKVGKFEVVASTRNSARLRYTSSVSESRLMCLSRQAQQRVLPEVWWSASPAQIEEHSCLAHGDDSCEYTVRWDEAFQMRGLVAGLIAGLAAAAALTAIEPGIAVGLTYVGLAVFGLFCGTTYELRRMLRGYNRLAATMSAESETMVQEHARAVDEVLALHERERRWSANLESTLAARRARLDEALGRLGREAPSRLEKLSHDLNNPLTVLVTGLTYMQTQPERSPQEQQDLAGMVEMTDRLATLVRELTEMSRFDSDARTSARDFVEIDTLTDRMRRQLTVTLGSRDIRPSVFKNREAPKAIESDALALERVIDNILTNTCKYTERGSIVVEVGGTPGFLLLKISDTGRGIGPERMEQVFLGGKADPNPIIGESHGAGLGIVVGLLDQLGGRLEIMSRPMEGTTIWVYVPVAPNEPEADGLSSHEDSAERFRRIVRIRPHD